MMPSGLEFGWFGGDHRDPDDIVAWRKKRKKKAAPFCIMLDV